MIFSKKYVTLSASAFVPEITEGEFMRYPKYLQPGETIGFVAPSFGCATEPYYTAFLNAQKKFTEKGYQLNLGPNCYESKGIGISNTPEACGKELTESYAGKKNQAIISCGGGELMCEILDYVDFEKIKEAEPKWYMGYSDNTNFTFLSATILTRKKTTPLFGIDLWTVCRNFWHGAMAPIREGCFCIDDRGKKYSIRL